MSELLDEAAFKTTPIKVKVKVCSLFEASVVMKTDSDSDHYLIDNFFRLFDRLPWHKVNQ